ncbi:MAG: hypothetical protein VYA84_17665 [Planctomycetota bacterium]|nr:hypothetical protein [Planctomycetota bacterium]
MTNPYTAPDETSDSEKPPRSRFGMLGCGCAVVLLGLVSIGFLSLFVDVEGKRMPPPVGIPLAPNSPEPTSTEPTTSAEITTNAELTTTAP